jgi:hypothetical protein
MVTVLLKQSAILQAQPSCQMTRNREWRAWKCGVAVLIFLLLSYMSQTKVRIFQMCARMQRASSKCALGCNVHLPNVRSDAVRIFQMCARMQCASSKCALGCSAHLPNVRSDAVRIFQMCARMQCASSKGALGCNVHLPNVRSDAVRIFQMCSLMQPTACQQKFQTQTNKKDKHRLHCVLFTLCSRSSYPDSFQVYISWRKELNSSLFLMLQHRMQCKMQFNNYSSKSGTKIK